MPRQMLVPQQRDLTDKRKYFRNFKRLFTFNKKNIILFICGLLCGIGSAVCFLFIPLTLNHFTGLISKATVNGNLYEGMQEHWSDLALDGIIMLALEGGVIVCDILSFSVIFTILNTSTTAFFRNKINDKINCLPIAYFQQHTTGSCLNTIVIDANQVGELFFSGLNGTFSAFFYLVGVLAAMFITSWQLSLVCICVLILSFILMGFIGPKIKSTAIKNAEANSDFNSFIEEMFTGNKTIKVYNQEVAVQTKFEEYNQRIYSAKRNSSIWSSFFGPIMQFCRFSNQIAICVTIAIMVNGKSADEIASLIALVPTFFLFSGSLNYPLGQISQNASNFIQSFSYANRIYDMLDAPEIEKIANPVALPQNIKGEIEFKKVCFKYSQKEEDPMLIKNLDLLAKPGQKIAIVGHTGAGKSTIINLLMRFYNINSGTITIDGVDINKVDEGEYRKNFGMVLQDTWTYQGTIKENIIYTTPNVDDKRLIDICERINIMNYINSLPNKFDTVLDDNTTMSYGYKQLLTIARAIVRDPKIIVLDEATSNVDTITEKMIQSAMELLMKKGQHLLLLTVYQL